MLKRYFERRKAVRQEVSKLRTELDSLYVYTTKHIEEQGKRIVELEKAVIIAKQAVSEVKRDKQIALTKKWLNGEVGITEADGKGVK